MPRAQSFTLLVLFFSEPFYAILQLIPPNFTFTSIIKYSIKAKMIKMMLIIIQMISGHILSDFGMIAERLLFILIIMRRSVRSKPSLPGTDSMLTAKLIHLARTIRKQGAK